MMDDRISPDVYFLGIAYLVAQRSTCIRRKVGAVAVSNKRILATGYNGAPPNMSHCTAETCIRAVEHIPSGQALERCKAIHAEANLLVQAAIHGVSLHGCTVYCTTAPCTGCTKLLIGIGCKRIVVLEDYPDPYGAQLRQEAGLDYQHVNLDSQKLKEIAALLVAIDPTMNP